MNTDAIHHSFFICTVYTTDTLLHLSEIMTVMRQWTCVNVYEQQ